PVTRCAGGLLHHRFTLAAVARRPRRRSVLCGTVPRVTPGGRYPPPCPSEPGRSSAGRSPTRPPDQLIRAVSLVQPVQGPPARGPRVLPCSSFSPRPKARRRGPTAHSPSSCPP